MRSFAVLLMIAAVACTDAGGSSTSGGGGTFGYYYADSADPPGALSVGSYNHSLQAMSGGRLFTIGQASAASADYVHLFAFDPARAFPVRKQLRWAGVRISAMVADGAGGIFLAGNLVRLVQPSYVAEPVLAHFDAKGAVLWSRSYHSAAQFGLPVTPSDAPDVGLSEVAAGHLVVLAGNTVIAVDPSTGAPQWARQTDVSAHQQAVASAGGVTVLGDKDSMLYAHRFDWTGALVAARRTELTAPQSAWRIFPPYVRANGHMLLPVATHVVQAQAGVIELDGDGALVDHWSYTLIALTLGVGAAKPSLDAAGPPRILSDGAKEYVAISGSYVEVKNTPPKAATLTAAIDAQGNPDASRFSTTQTAPWMLGNGSLVAVGTTFIGIGDLGAPCSHYPVTELLRLERTVSQFKAGAKTDVYTAGISPLSDVTAVDLPATTTDVPDYKLSPLSAAGCK